MVEPGFESRQPTPGPSLAATCHSASPPVTRNQVPLPSITQFLPVGTHAVPTRLQKDSVPLRSCLLCHESLPLHNIIWASHRHAVKPSILKSKHQASWVPIALQTPPPSARSIVKLRREVYTPQTPLLLQSDFHPPLKPPSQGHG